MEAACPFLFMIAFFGVALLLGQQQAAASSRALSAFMRALDDASGQTEVGLFGGLSRAWVKGVLDGRAVALDFAVRGSGKSKYTVAIYTLDVEHAAANFELSKAGVLDWLGALFVDRPKIHDSVDRDLVLRAGSTDAVRRLFQQDTLGQRLRVLIDGMGFRSVSLQGGRLRVEQRVAHGTLELARLKSVFNALAEVAALCERKRVTIKVVPGLTVKPRFAWTGGGSTSLCPYCREQVDAEQEQQVDACDRCGTLHHRACLDEAGGCTIFGCGSKSRDRARAT